MIFETTSSGLANFAILAFFLTQTSSSMRSFLPYTPDWPTISRTSHKNIMCYSDPAKSCNWHALSHGFHKNGQNPSSRCRGKTDHPLFLIY